MSVYDDNGDHDRTIEYFRASDRTPHEIADWMVDKLTQEQLDSFPEPYSKEPAENKLGRRDCKEYDYYDYRLVTGEFIKGQWYVDFVMKTPEGRELSENGDKAKCKRLAHKYRKAIQLIRQVEVHNA